MTIAQSVMLYYYMLRVESFPARNSQGVTHKRNLPQSVVTPIPDLRSGLDDPTQATAFQGNKNEQRSINFSYKDHYFSLRVCPYTFVFRSLFFVFVSFSFFKRRGKLWDICCNL